MASPRPVALDDLRALVSSSGLARVHVLGWRDLADPEAGGSELHLHEIATRWAAAGVEVTVRTSAAVGAPPREERSGYHVVRGGGRMTVFPRAAAAELSGRYGPRDGLVEIWNGVPWCSPLWARGPRVVWLHHVHGPMWTQTLGPRLGPLGRALEARLAPRWYRRERIVTLAETSRRELIDDLGFAPDRVSVVPPGIDPRFCPDGSRAPSPVVLAVGRLVPVKQYGTLLTAMAEVHRAVPAARLVIVGDGYERADLEARSASLGLHDVVRFAGRIDDDEVLELYRRAWIVASASSAEGWGMTLTEAAACGTPAVVTDIVGHRDAVHHDRSGLVVAPAELASAITRLLTDSGTWARLSRGALDRAGELTWDATAVQSFSLLAEEAQRCRT